MVVEEGGVVDPLINGVIDVFDPEALHRDGPGQSEKETDVVVSYLASLYVPNGFLQGEKERHFCV